MACEAKRGCGFRKFEGLYLVGSGLGLACDRLPIELSVCPCCGAGIKQTRGFTWVDIASLVGGDHAESFKKIAVAFDKPEHFENLCECPATCPLCCNTKSMGRGGLLWIGTQFYPTIEAFEMEARTLGISRRITTVPRGFELGKTWILFAHARGIIKPTSAMAAEYVPAIFRVWKPERLERIYKESERGSEAVQKDIERGITPVFFPDNDRDHQGSVYDKDEEPAAAPISQTEPLPFTKVEPAGTKVTKPAKKSVAKPRNKK